MKVQYFIRHRKGDGGWGLHNIDGGFRKALAYAENLVQLNRGSAVIYSRQGNLTYGHLEDGMRVPYAQSHIYGNPLKPHEEKALAGLMSR